MSTSDGASGPAGLTGLPENVRTPVPASGTEVVVEESIAEYRTVWQVRKYDLENLRGDLNRLDTKGRWLIPVGSSLASVSVTTFVTWAIEVWGHQGASFDLKLGLVVTVIVSGLLSLTFFCLDKGLGQRATGDLKDIKGRLDKLISMFPKSDET